MALLRPWRSSGICGLVAAGLLCATPRPATAQQASAPALKAAFLNNFAKFTEWPDDVRAAGQLLSVCVVGDHAVADALVGTMKQGADGPVTVTFLKADGNLRGCQLLYIGGTDAKSAALALDAVKGASVFTVGEADHFAEAGGVAQLVQENGRMRFAINPAAAQRARLTLSAKLLNLAILIKDTPHATR